MELFVLFLVCVTQASAHAMPPVIGVHWSKPDPEEFPVALEGRPAAIYLAPEDAVELEAATGAFASDIERVTGSRPAIISDLSQLGGRPVILIGIAGRTIALQKMQQGGRLSLHPIAGKWESSLTTVVDRPLAGVAQALVVAGSDRRGTAFALFALSRRMGVSPWIWWADVPVTPHQNVSIAARNVISGEPSVRYRGIFLNDEDWGLRPWAAKKMDPDLGNIGPHTYERIFELILRLRADSLWPAMHPGTLPFNAVPENARLADRWGIVMGSSHSEALLRNNVGEWNETTDGPWNYQLNQPAIDRYWEKRVAENGHFENFYTVGMRGVHDTGLEATGTVQEKSHLVEQAMTKQRELLATHVSPLIASIPQVLWLYKESLELYRAGMKVPDDVTLGWTDDNYGYIRQLPTPSEQQRSGGSGVYYHVSYWGFPHDYLWLCSTPPALIREEMTKAFDHNARRYWILNVGDLKPAESDIDYFMQLAWDEPAMAHVEQKTYLRRWTAEQFPARQAPAIAGLLDRYYQLNFVRKPEFMGFNGYNDGINRTAFNPLAWGDQDRQRDAMWQRLNEQAIAIGKQMPALYRDAYFELVGYPVQAAAAQNRKFLATDRSFLAASRKQESARQVSATQARSAFDRIQFLTAEYNSLDHGKWESMMSSSPRNREVFTMPVTAAAADSGMPLPGSWGAGTSAGARETISLSPEHFTRSRDGARAAWTVLDGLGISGASVVFGAPGSVADAVSPPSASNPWIEYQFSTTHPANAQISVYLLPTFPIDSEHRLRFGLSVDGAEPTVLDQGSTGEWHEDTAPVWAANVLRNAAVIDLPIGKLKPGEHRLRLNYIDPGVVFEHLVVSFRGTPPAYPVPPNAIKIP
jgi:hypothetical protein